MVWGCRTVTGLGNSELVGGSVDAAKYQQVL